MCSECPAYEGSEEAWVVFFLIYLFLFIIFGCVGSSLLHVGFL